MKHTEEQMLTKAIQVLTDLNPQYFKEESIEAIHFSENKDVARPQGLILDAWTIAIDIPVFDATNFLTISDETGEPMYIQSSHLVVEIEQNSEGIYIRKK